MIEPLINQLSAALALRYRIERELGHGGMATVYLAQDLKHHRQVAIKVLHPHLAAVVGSDRFLKEIRTTAHLQHPHLLPLFDSGDADGLLFYVMPFVDGETLRERLTREGPLPIADALRIASEVAGALDHAHRHGVIHRDIKPENILLREGSALIADFGIALASTTGEMRLTETGMSIGTPQYMSPEQALGERQLDARSDIYATGAMLYEMLTGSPPFTGPSSQAIVARVLTEKPVPPSRRRKEVSAAIDAVVLTALQKDPAARFANAVALRDAIESGSIPAQYGRPRLGRGGQVGVAIGVGAVAIAALLLWHSGRTPLRTPRPRAAPDTAAVRLVAEAADWAKRRDAVSCGHAIKLYSQATDHDSTYAVAWGGLAKAHALCALFSTGDPDVEFSTARGQVETALRLDESLPDAYTTRGMVHEFHEQDFAGAQRDFARAIHLDSTRYEPWLFRTWSYVAENELDSAIASVRHAKALEPVGDPVVAVRLATILRMQGDTAGAEHELGIVLQRDPGNVIAHAEQFEMDVAARDCVHAAKDLASVNDDPSQYTRAMVANYWSACGLTGLARRYADSVEAAGAGDAYVDRFSLAMVYAGLGDTTRMFRSLDGAVARHSWLLFYLHHHYAFRAYAGMPQFAQILVRAHVG